MNACSHTNQTRRYGLIGYPIAHSGSPALFRRAYGGKWDYDLIETPSFEQAWERFLEGYDAINVTAPFKELAAARADIKSPEVLAIGAANIAVKTRCGVKAFNSDYLGVRMLLEELSGAGAVAPGPAAEGKGDGMAARVLVVGFGGAGKAAAAAARDLGLETTVCNRSDHGNPSVRPFSEMTSVDADLLIYTLPMLIPEVEDWLKAYPQATILEANYRDPVLAPTFPADNPATRTASTSVPADAKPSLGYRYIPGERWLLAQAITGYELLTGEKPLL